jgi:ParB-like chromosome segregation protein Spo0J
MATTAKDKGRKAIEKKNRALERLVIEYVPANSIRPNAYNPNRQSDHDFELLCRSMQEDGFTQPIVCQQETREFVDGEHRWTGWIVVNALQRRGLPITTENCRAMREKRLEVLAEMPDLELPVVFTDMTPEQMRIATLRHNRARGSEDIELTAQVLRDLQALGAIDWAQDSLMLDDVELNRLLEDFPAPEALAAEEYSPAWEPTDKLDGQTEETVVRDGNAPGHVIVQAMTPAAIEARREEERRYAQAKTEEEKRIVKQESQLYRVHLVFAGEEAAVVSEVLGDKPAEMLLTLCRLQRERS